VTAQGFDPISLSIEERLELIELLWKTIEDYAVSGNRAAAGALNWIYKLDPETLAELERRAGEVERDPSKTIR
jgi:hypothetical protein